MVFRTIQYTVVAIFLTFSITVSASISAILAVDAQTVPVPKFVPKPRENIQTSNDQLAMMIQLAPHTENEVMRESGYYQVIGWQLAISNPSSLCPSQNCVFQLEGGVMGPEFISPGERVLTGKLKIGTGDTTKIRDLGASWAAVEERMEGGQMVQVIEGTMTLGNDRFGPENRYQINGTLAPYGQDVLLALQGSAKR